VRQAGFLHHVGHPDTCVAVPADRASGGDIGVTPPSLFTTNPSQWFYESAVVLTGVSLGVTALIVRSRFGYQLQAIREDEETAQACGIDAARTKLRSLRRVLEEKHQVAFSSCSTPQELDLRLPSLFELHERRWRQRGQSGVFGSERKRAFYREIGRDLLQRGGLQFHTLEVDGVPVAHQFCMGYRTTVYLLQEGYDPAWEPHGVGNVLRAMVFERLIAEGWPIYDFLAGVTDHKLSWGGTVKESARLSARGRGWRGQLVAGLLGAASALRRGRREAKA